MDTASAAETELLQANVTAAKSRLRQAQRNLTSVLNLLSELPDALKTGVMRAIETSFEDLGQAEKHVVEMEDIVRNQASGAHVGGPGTRCPHCERPYAKTDGASIKDPTA
jgi:hypothetical protein